MTSSDPEKDAKTKAEEAAEAARLAEEAAEKAREAARLAQIAADEEESAKSLQKPQEDKNDPEDTPDDDTTPEEDSAPPEPPSPEPPSAEKTAFRTTSLPMVIAVLAVLAIAFGTSTTVLALKVRDQNATQTASKEASFAASRAAQKLSSYDSQTLDADLKSASATTTGKLRTDYDKLARELRTVAVQQQAVSTTTIMKVGVVEATPDRVVALVYANRSSATKADKQQRLPEPLRIKMTMVKKDGKWLASELTVIS